jgi:hypothetical protein
MKFVEGIKNGASNEFKITTDNASSLQVVYNNSTWAFSTSSWAHKDESTDNCSLP